MDRALPMLYDRNTYGLVDCTAAIIRSEGGCEKSRGENDADLTCVPSTCSEGSVERMLLSPADDEQDWAEPPTDVGARVHAPGDLRQTPIIHQ